MLHWYADNSELTGIWGAEIPDILLFGGVVVDSSQVGKLSEALNKVKVRYRPECDFPLKWNMKDLKEWFSKTLTDDLYQRIEKESRDWRKEIFEGLVSLDFKIVISCLLAFGTARNTLKSKRQDVSQFTFSNGLMRFALLVKEAGADSADVILDWPDKGNRAPFDDEYRSAYLSGSGYLSGNLRKIGFSDSLLYSNMRECAILQLSDMVVGACREFVEFALDKRDRGQGVEMLSVLKGKFRGAPDRIIGYGLSVSPSKGELKDKLTSALSKL